MGNLLAGIDCPADLKYLQLSQLGELAAEMRSAISVYVDECGGHLASNLGMVELSIALHYVFDAPRDKIVFDVSHQCYAHKMLTGRRVAFTDPTRFGAASGFTDPNESNYDLFKVGHASTATSLACGLAYARDLQEEHYAVVAVVGDGALSGGETFEGLNHAAALGTGLIIVINDNERSIAENVGGLYQDLAELRKTGGTSKRNLFRALGLDYRYVEGGHDIEALIAALRAVRGTSRPTVVHVHTKKGRGYRWAEDHPEDAHELQPHLKRISQPSSEQYIQRRLAEHLAALASAQPQVAVISPATPLSHGITPGLRDRLGAQYVDVGIAEEHAFSFAAAAARGGAKPIVCVSSTFLQRAYDQLVVDVALNGLPVTVLCYKAGLAERDATHVGSLDVAFESPIPGLVCLAPHSLDECVAMLEWAVAQSDRPVVIRVPRSDADSSPSSFDENNAERWLIEHRGSRVAFITLGRIVDEVRNHAVPLVKDRLNIDASIICARSYSKLDTNMLDDLCHDHELAVVVEDGMVDGGLGQRIATYYCNSTMHVLVRGAAKEFTQRIPLSKQYQRFRLTGELLANDVADALERHAP